MPSSGYGSLAKRLGPGLAITEDLYPPDAGRDDAIALATQAVSVGPCEAQWLNSLLIFLTAWPKDSNLGFSWPSTVFIRIFKLLSPPTLVMVPRDLSRTVFAVQGLWD